MPLRTLGRAMMCLAIVLSCGVTIKAQDKKTPPKPVPADPKAAQTADVAEPAASSTDPWYTWNAQVKVDLGGPETQSVKRHGRVQAADAAAARKKAVADLEGMIASQFEGLAKMVPSTLKIEVAPLVDAGAKPVVKEHHDVQIFATITCCSALEFESTLPFVGGKKVVENFLIRAAVESDGKTDSMEGSIRTVGRGKDPQAWIRRFLLWQGPVYLDDRGTSVTVKLDQVCGRVDIGPTGWPEETTTVGKLRVTVRNNNGRLVASIQPLEQTKIAGKENGLVTRTTISAGGNSYRAAIVVTSPEETAAARIEAKKKQDERNQAIQPRPDEGVEVFSGSVTQDMNDKANKRRSQVGTGLRIIVTTANQEAGVAYVQRVYPKSNLVKIVKDKNEAEEYLKLEWAQMLKKPPFNSYEFIAGTQKVNLTPKKGETRLDRLSDSPGRRRP